MKGYDYSRSGMYFVTICVNKRKSVFGKIMDCKMVLNDFGKIAHDEWAKTPDIRSNVQLDVFVVMPNHIHGIIVITNDNGGGRGVSHTPNTLPPHTLHTFHDETVHQTLPPPLHSPHNKTDVCNRGVCDTPLRSPSNTVGAIVRGYKSSVTKQLNQLGFIGSVWQHNYWEHIIRNEQSYQRIANYIINNPENWKNDDFFAK